MLIWIICITIANDNQNFVIALANKKNMGKNGKSSDRTTLRDLGPEYLRDLYPNCGNYTWPSVGSRKTRLAGGSQAQLKQFPSFVRILIRPSADPDRITMCGGTILDRDRILTAAHCVEHWQKSWMEIFAGLNSDIYNSAAHLQMARPATVCIHPDYKVRKNCKQEPGANDIAVIKLQRKLIFTDYVQPACVLFQRRPHVPVNNKEPIYAVGFGDTDRGRFSHKLLFVRMNIDQCKNEHYPDTNSCIAPGESGAGFCLGDAGGGLYKIQRGKQFLIGIAIGYRQTQNLNTSTIGYCQKDSHIESYYLDISKIWKQHKEICK